MKFLAMLSSAGIGAALAYFYDPLSGNRRRALVREKANRSLREAQHFLDVASRDLQNRSRGWVEDLRSHIVSEKVDDDRLVRRVASKLGHHVLRAKDIGITAENGIVTLQGTIMRSELDAALHAIGRIPGVKEVRNELEVQETPETPMTQQAVMRKKWTPARRLAMGSAGLILAASTRSLMRGRGRGTRRA